MHSAYSTHTIAGYQRSTFRSDIRRSLALAIPLIGAQLLSMGNGLVDALVAGQLGSVQLAAGGIAAGIWFFASLSCIGMMAGLSPILSRLLGERRHSEVGGVFRQGLMLGLVVGILATALLLLFANNLHWTGMEPELLPFIRQYLVAASWSLPFYAIVMAARNFCEATGFTRPVIIVQAVGLLVNTVADLLFGLGWFGFPKFGLTGIGIATTLVMVSMAAVLIGYLSGRRFSRYKPFERFDRPDWRRLRSMMTLALPITIGIGFEAGLFVATTIQMGMLGTREAAAHYIAMGATSVCFMLPLGLSFALTARIGRADGREALESVRLRIYSGVTIMIVMAFGTAALLVLLRHPIASLYTQDTDIRAFAASLLLMAALFQLSDGLQIAMTGILRGLHDTRAPMWINGFSYWVVAFGIGHYSAFYLDYGAYGLWAGLIIGLTVASILLAFRLKVVMARKGIDAVTASSEIAARE